MKLKIVAIMILILVFMGFVSGCIDASYTLRGKITGISQYINQFGEGDITVIYFGNNGYEFKTESISKYRLQVGDDVILEISDLTDKPYTLKNMYYRYGEG
jgi:hypothetical protein